MILHIQQQTSASLRQICHAFELPRSSFHHAKSPTQRHLQDQSLGGHIEHIFHSHKRRYGSRRIYHPLCDQGIRCAPNRIRRIMQQRGLKAIQPKNFIPKTSDGKALHPAPNLLANTSKPTTPNTIWTGDITYIPTTNGYLYLSVVMDLASRKILVRKLDTHIRSDLVADAFQLHPHPHYQHFHDLPQ